MVSLSYKRRLQDLQDHIAKDGKLLNEFENAFRFEDNPKRRAKYQWEIEQLRQSMVRYRDEYDAINGQVTVEMQTVADQLQQMDQKIDAVLSGQSAIALQLTHMQQTLLDRYDESERSLIATVVEQLDDRQVALTQRLVDGLESHRLAEAEIDEMWAVLAERLLELPPQQAAVADWARSPGLDARHRLKVTLPIMPLLVDYKAEFELNGGLDFKGLWEAVKAKLKRPKSQAVQKPIWQVAREIREGLSEEDLRGLPKDGAVNHDHYIYGTPKVDS